MKRRNMFLGGVCVAALAGFSFVEIAPAFAQMDEIIVTSRKREESLLDVPIAVTAFTQDQIDRIAPSNLRDFDQLAPNLFIGINTAGPSAGAVFIRGQGYADIEKTQNPAVGVIVDGLFLGTNTFQLVEGFDVAQVEVNRGPQGVLFGKNTTGGTIVIRRSDPQYEWGAKGSARLGNFGTREYAFRATGPIIEDKAAFKIGGSKRESDGFFTNEVNGQSRGAVDVETVNAELQFNPTDALQINLTFDVVTDRGDIPPQDPRFDGDDPFINRSDINEFQELDQRQWIAEINWDSGFGTFTSISGFLDSEDLVLQDFDGGQITDEFNFPFSRLHTLRDQSYQQFSQELRWNHDLWEDRINVTLGGYAFFAEIDLEQQTEQNSQIPVGLVGGALGCTGIGGTVVAGGLQCRTPLTYSTQRSGESTDAYSAFAHANVEVIENLNVSGGFRYIFEEKDFFTTFSSGADQFAGGLGSQFVTGFGVVPAGTVTFPLLTDTEDFNDVITKVSVDWSPDVPKLQDFLIYASRATGFRSGGFSIRGTDPAFLTFEPENTRTYEVGSKMSFLGGRVQLNVAAFDTQIEGQQFSSIITLAPGAIPGTNTVILNHDETEIQGVELELTAAFTEFFRLRGSFGFQDGEVVSSTQDAGTVPVGADNLPGTADDGVVGTLGVPVTFGGIALGRTPEFTTALGFDFEHPIPNTDFLGFVSFTWTYQDDFFLIVPTLGVPVQEGGYHQFDVTAGFETTFRDVDMRIEFIGRNLSDEEFREQALPLLGTGGFQGWAPPRTVAGQLTVEF